MIRRALTLATFAMLTIGAHAADPVSFSKDIVPVLRNQCAVCHLTGTEPGNMSLVPKAAYTTLVGAPSTESKLQRVKPGSAQESYLMHKLDGTQISVGGQGARMPFDGPPLDAETLDKIRRWIEAGAPNN
jgi:hypothetical protein